MVKVIRLVTEDSAESLKAATGSASWYGTKARFSEASYFVAVRPGDRKPFFIADIAEIVRVPESGDNRWGFQFSRYAELDPARYEADRSSNPAISMELSRILPELSVDTIEWKKATGQTQPWSFSNSPRELRKTKKPLPRGLTIAEAKQGLSIGLGVAPEQIEIFVKG